MGPEHVLEVPASSPYSHDWGRRRGVESRAELAVLPGSAEEVAAVVAWSAARSALLGDASPPVTALAVALFVAVWGGALALAGLVAAWRSAAWSLAVMGDHRVGGLVPGSGGTL